MTKEKKPKAWENGVSFLEDVISLEKRKQLVQEAAERAAQCRQMKLQNAILKNKAQLEEGILRAAQRYISSLNFDNRPSASEIDRRLHALKEALLGDWKKLEHLISEDDATAYRLREAVYDLKFSDMLEDMIERRSADFIQVIERALEMNAVWIRPGRQAEMAASAFPLVGELARVWESATGKLAGVGHLKPSKHRKKEAEDAAEKAPEMRYGPFVDFVCAVMMAIPNWETIPDLKNPSLAVKKALGKLRKNGKLLTYSQ
jgi:hypothetical protein